MKSTLLGLLLSLLVSIQVHAQKKGYTLLAVGQGVSIPTITSPINESHGFTYNNSAVARFYDGALLSLEYDKNENSSGAGVEFGVGTGDVGLGVGYYKPDCNNCDGRFGVLAGFGLGDTTSFGLGYREEKSYSVGTILGLGGAGQIGLTVDFHDYGNSNLNTYSYGVGYGYSGENLKIAVDLSKRQDGDSSTDDSAMMLTPGLLLDTGFVRLAVSHDTYIDDKNNVYDDKTWFGVGVGDDSKWSLNFYKDYTAEYSGVLTFWF